MRKPLLCVIALVGSLAAVAFGQEAPRDKKLIEWGWDEPDTKFMRENVQEGHAAGPYWPIVHGEGGA